MLRTLDAVLVHCREPLAWVAQWLPWFPAFVAVRLWVYEKCGGRPQAWEAGVAVPIRHVDLPNVGFNDHGYLTHLVWELDTGNVADATILLPANPHDQVAGRVRGGGGGGEGGGSGAVVRAVTGGRALRTPAPGLLLTSRHRLALGTPPTWTPLDPPLKDWAKFSSGLSANYKLAFGANLMRPNIVFGASKDSAPLWGGGGAGL